MLLQKIEGLDALVNLEELWLGKNKIGRLEVRRIHPFYNLISTNVSR